MRPIMLTTLLAAVVFGGSSGGFAQSVEIYPDKPYYYDEYGKPTPRVYQYRADPPIVVRPLRPANCGEFRYWNGERCVDARVVPPDIR
jgi:hypothetical protein